MRNDPWWSKTFALFAALLATRTWLVLSTAIASGGLCVPGGPFGKVPISDPLKLSSAVPPRRQPPGSFAKPSQHVA
jgi:hypothetical protein